MNRLFNNNRTHPVDVTSCPFEFHRVEKQLVESELNLGHEIALMQHDLQLVQDDTRFKRWLKQQKSAQSDFDPLDFF